MPTPLLDPFPSTDHPLSGRPVDPARFRGTVRLGRPVEIENATRREFLTGAAATALLVGCGTNSTGDGPAGPPEWSFTDDRGETVTLPARPVRIAMQEDVAGALLPFGIRPIGVYGNDLISLSPQFRDVDIDGIEQFGAEYGVLNLEQLAALDPELIVVPAYSGGDVTGMGFGDQAQYDLARQIAPIVAIDVADKPYSEMIDRFAVLAEALGADPSTPEILRMREDFDAAREELRAAAGAAPDLRVMAASPSDDVVFVSSPGADSELAEYEALGLRIIGVGEPGFTEISWETIGEQPADVVLLDGRSFGADLEFLATHPIWPTLPAVRAGQVGSWFVGTMYRMPFFTRQLRELAALVERSAVVRPAS